MNTTTETSLQLDVKMLKEGALILRALNNDLRQKIIKLFHAQGGIMVTTMYTKLKILRDARFVITERVVEKFHTPLIMDALLKWIS